MLEMGKDGTLRYFSKSGGGERREVWSVVGNFGVSLPECSLQAGIDENDASLCVQDGDMGATFVKEGESWFVLMGRTRFMLNPDVIRDFTS